MVDLDVWEEGRMGLPRIAADQIISLVLEDSVWTDHIHLQHLVLGFRLCFLKFDRIWVGTRTLKI